ISSAAQMPSSLLRRASALNFFSASKANLASSPRLRSSNPLMQLSQSVALGPSGHVLDIGGSSAQINAAAAVATNCGIVDLARLPSPAIMRKNLHNGPVLSHEAAQSTLLSTGLGISMNRRRKIYEGKAKILFEGPEPGTLVQYFKDDATAGNGAKHEVIDGKGVLNNRISEFIFSKLNDLGIPTHFLRRINMREQLIKEVEIIPLEIIVRNVAAGSLAKRLGLEPGTRLPRSI